MKYNNLILIIFGMLFFYILFTKKEGMSNTAIDNRIKAIYQADINSIRNLSKLANDLTANGKLVVPGGLEIKGDLKVGGNVGVKRDPHPKVGLIVNATGLAQGVETQGAGIYADKKLHVNGPLFVNGTTRLNGNVGIRTEALPKVGLIVNGAGLVQGVETSGAGIYADKKLHVNGPLFVNGTTRLDGNVGVKRDPHPKVGFIVNAAGLAVGVETSGAGIYADKRLHVNGTTRLNGNVGVRRDPHPKVGLLVNGSGLSVGMETNTNIHTRDLMATRYIGARNEIASKAGLYAKCRSVNDSGYGSKCRKRMN